MGFSFAIGGLSSVLSTLDAKAAKLKEKLSTLEDIRNEYKMSYNLYRRLRVALNYDHSKNSEEQVKLLQAVMCDLWSFIVVSVDITLFKQEDEIRDLNA